MTQPTPNDQAAAEKAAAEKAAAEKAAAEKAAAEKAAAEKARAAVKRLDVVKFVHRDVLTGRDTERIGVVVRAEKDAPTVAVRPLEHYFHEVDPAELSVITAADVD